MGAFDDCKDESPVLPYCSGDMDNIMGSGPGTVSLKGPTELTGGVTDVEDILGGGSITATMSCVVDECHVTGELPLEEDVCVRVIVPDLDTRDAIVVASGATSFSSADELCDGEPGCPVDVELDIVAVGDTVVVDEYIDAVDAMVVEKGEQMYENFDR